MAQQAQAVVQATPPPIIVTTAIRAKAEDNLRRAKVQLVIHQPFYASIVLKRRIEINDTIPSAYCTALGKIVLGTVWFSSLTVQECVFVLAHECSHYIMLHHMRVGWRKPRQANIAMDKVINDILIHNKIGTAPKEGVFMEGAREFAWEQLYDTPDEEGGGGGGDSPYTPGTGTDDLSGEGIGDVTPEQLEELKQEVIQARMASQKVGKLPSGMEKLIDELINPPTPWYTLLERYMLFQIKAGTSWRRPAKRFIGHDLYLPSVGTENCMGTVVIQMDESGSVDDKQIQHFGGHISKIIETCRPEKVILLHTDTEVDKHVDEYTLDDMPLTIKTYRRGGTDMTAGFKWCADNGVEPDVFICLTDGYTPFGEPQPYPVVWLITSDVVADHGETIHYEVVE